MGTFYSAQNTNYPPMPVNLYQLPAWDLGDGIYLLDDTNVDYAVMHSSFHSFAESSPPRTRWDSSLRSVPAL